MLRVGTIVCIFSLLWAGPCFGGASLKGAFPIGYWWGPPPEENTKARWKEVLDAGFTFAGIGRKYQLADHLKMLAFCRELGLPTLIHDRRLDPRMTAQPGWEKRVHDIVESYHRPPALMGFLINDEPSVQMFPAISKLRSALKKEDPSLLAYTNLYPVRATSAQTGFDDYSDYLEQFVQQTLPPVLSFDNYTFLESGERGDFFLNLEQIRATGLKYNLPIWNIIQAVQVKKGFLEPTLAQLRWQAFSSLAYGVKGLLYFYYWQVVDGVSGRGRGLVDANGKITSLYEEVKAVNVRVQSIGKILLPMISTGVFHTWVLPPGTRPLPADSPIIVDNSLPLVIGVFRSTRDRSGAVLIVNRDYENEHSFSLLIRNNGLVSVTLEPGDGALFLMKNG